MTCKMTPCPVETTLQLISSRWKVLIIRDLLEGTKRFGELRKSHRSRNTESPDSQSAAMEEDGLLTRKVYAEVPPRVEYTLTELGYSLHPILASMSRWGKAYQQMDIHQAR